MTEDLKKYNFMEPMLAKINQKYISITKEDETRNNRILQALITLITDKMKEKDKLFKEMFSTVFYGGSYYDGLRVGQPDEFDLDLLLNLPRLIDPVLSTSNVPGYVHIKFQGMPTFYKQPALVEQYKQRNDSSYSGSSSEIRPKRRHRRRRRPYYGFTGLDKLIENDYLDTGKTLRWMERVTTLALNDFSKDSEGWYVLKTSQGTFAAKIKKGGPAFTLVVKGAVQEKIDIDLVPCFIFGKERWPKNGFKSNPVEKTKPNFFIVPKPLTGIPHSSRYWRLSFQEQERILIDGKRTLKPVIKLLKKLRDRYNHKCIASYYLKTVVLWQVEKRNDAFWQNSLSYVFMTILKEYYQCLENAKIFYYWNRNNNLISKVNLVTLSNLTNLIKSVIQDVEQHLGEANYIAKHLLTPQELANLDR